MPDLYDLFGALPEVNRPDVPVPATPQPQRPRPGTVLTASVETIDNDRAGLLLGAVNV